MDVKRCAHRIALLTLFVVFGSACENKKSAQSVFPGSNQKNGSAEITCQTAAINFIPTRFIVHWEDGHVSVESSENADLFTRDFIEPKLSEIRHVEYDRWITLDGNLVHAEATADNSWGQKAIQVDTAHAQGIKGQGVVVAVVDTAVDGSHPLLQKQMVPGWDFVSNTDHASSPHEHATHIAGVIAAEEGGAVVSLAPQAKIMSVSFMDSSGSGALSDSIKALNFAGDHGAKIINNSWGGDRCSETLRLAMRSLSDKGVLLMVAAGNEGVDISQSHTFPASFTNPLQITVGASQFGDIMTAFTNTSWSLVHLVAPGQDIYSTIPGGYGMMTGTSMATPFLSGAAALLMSAKPTATPAQIRQALLNSVDPGPFRVSTQGRLNVQRALDEIRRLVP